ncbi:glycosyltransferase family 2 protein [Tahibacter sp.]|uniref:glycosyltransferase family 2 protein n=1 Tax=Tahibacter sp. TaxID=2056211 RepID=UPI0028C43240|nr:glycosyltransferase family 2 protein [Tahibacter sp.]
MRISLIVATVGRSAELERLLESLVLQAYPDLEVIVVDQNRDDRVLRTIKKWAGRLPIIHLVSDPGASRARNVGLAAASGDIIGFPDDDCWYPPNLLRRVSGFLSESVERDGIIGHTVGEDGRATLPWNDGAGLLSASMSWRRSVTYAYFFRRRAALAVGGFDVSLGPGAGTPWGAGDDNDFMLRALENGARVFFDPELTVHHPPLFLGFDAESIAKRTRYARADGRVLRKHPMPSWWMLAFFGMPLARWVLAAPSLDAARLRFHWATFLGRVRGYRDPAPA